MVPFFMLKLFRAFTIKRFNFHFAIIQLSIKGIRRHIMHAWESIQTTIDYIEENLGKDIQMIELANQAHLSIFYYQRLFKRLVNISVMEYIKRRRLARASEYLSRKSDRIIDVAFQFGFESHEQFTRSFKEIYGMTPEQFRNAPIILNHFIKPELILNYIMVEEGVPLICDNMVLEVNKKVLLKERYFVGYSIEVPIVELMGGENTGIASVAPLWDKLHREIEEIRCRCVDANEIGVLYMGNAKEGNCMYMAGIEVDHYFEQVGFQSFKLPVNEYYSCGFEAESESELYGSAVFKADKFMERWFSSHQLTNRGEFAIEMYFPNKRDPYYLEHWCVMKKSL